MGVLSIHQTFMMSADRIKHEWGKKLLSHGILGKNTATEDLQSVVCIVTIVVDMFECVCVLFFTYLSKDAENCKPVHQSVLYSFVYPWMETATSLVHRCIKLQGDNSRLRKRLQVKP